MSVEGTIRSRGRVAERGSGGLGIAIAGATGRRCDAAGSHTTSPKRMIKEQIGSAKEAAVAAETYP
jgi:hypothetical protein